jgi:NO-binding membrane sensor protein with MHYT domain
MTIELPVLGEIFWTGVQVLLFSLSIVIGLGVFAALFEAAVQLLEKRNSTMFAQCLAVAFVGLVVLLVLFAGMDVSFPRSHFAKPSQPPIDAVLQSTTVTGVIGGVSE